MNTDKKPTKGLDTWLQKAGLSPNQEKSAPNVSPQNNKPANHKPAPRPTASPTDQPRSQSRPSGPRPPRPNTNRPSGDNSGGGGSRFGRHASGARKFSDHDPDKGRHTSAKRHDQHAINKLGHNGKGDVKIVSLGGLDAIGQNLTYVEYNNEIIVIDTGILFATHDEPGIDGVVPDVSYLEKNKHRIKGVIYTHGHLDHIGGAQYILPKLGFPKIYTSPLTAAMLTENMKEYGIDDKLKFSHVFPRQTVHIGGLDVEFFHINHSIPECLGVNVHTPYGGIAITMDFKFDYHPLDGHMTDFIHLSQMAHKGIALHLCDSTNAMNPGFARSESAIVEPITKILKHTTGRVILTQFGSNMSRASKIVEIAESLGRTVYISGRSLVTNIAHARTFNYLKCKESTVKRLARGVKVGAPHKTLIMCTGGQGEEFAALTRMARGDHAQVKLTDQDTVVFSSSKIPGNEGPIGRMMDNLVNKGVKIIEGKEESIHATGHGNQEDIKLMVTMLNPKYFVPIHGEGYQRYTNKKMIARALDFPDKYMVTMEHGKGIILNAKGARLMTDKEMIKTSRVYYEGGTTVSQETLDTRIQIAKRGLIIIHVEIGNGGLKNMELHSIGFRYVATDSPMKELLKELKKTFSNIYKPGIEKKNLANTLTTKAKQTILQKGQHDEDAPIVEAIIS